jgi:VanZ family protein
MNLVRAILLPLILMVLIFIESSIPMDGGPDNIKLLTNLNPNFQNMLHIPLYACLSCLWFRAFSQLRVNPSVGMVLTLFFAITYGCIDEIHQSFVPGRYGGLLDICLNILGVIIGIGVFYTYLVFKQKLCKSSE